MFLALFVRSKPELLQYVHAEHLVSLWPQGVLVFVGVLSTARLTRLVAADGLVDMMGGYLEPLEQREREGEEERRRGLDWIRESLRIVLAEKTALEDTRPD